MALGRGEEQISVMEAVDQLSNMAEIDLKTPGHEEFEEVEGAEINWRDPRQALKNEPLIKETFRVVHKYLQNVVRTDKSSLTDPQVQKGIQAIMLIATEAASKMDKYVALHPDQYKPISHLKEYQDLQKYYLQQILHQMPPPKEEEEEWESDLKHSLEGQKKGLRDLEGVRKDSNYELFFIRDEAKRPYFSRGLLRHIRLVGNFDELVSRAEGEDPLLRIRELVDRELQESAAHVLKQVAPYLDEFYQEAMKLKERSFIAELNKAIMALRMAANIKNLIENQSYKSCLEYYCDFHLFLRNSMQAPGYIKRLHGKEKDLFTHVLLNLTHALCCYFFHRVEPRKETLALIHKMIERGEEMRKPYKKKEEGEFSDFYDADKSLRHLLNHYPNGPIMRTLDAFREEEEFDGFDPLTHQNFPTQLFNFENGDLHITALRMPCPIKQHFINEATVVDEFTGLLQYYLHELKPDRHLLVNLQDRTARESYARCQVLEGYAENLEYKRSLSLLGLPMEGSFYFQDGDFEVSSGAPVFLEQFEAFLLGGKEGGCVLPYKDEMEEFVPNALKVLHKSLFNGAATLKKAERLIFIDLFYFFLTLKVVELSRSDSLSFTCKDGVDKGAVQGALFFAFIRRIASDKPFTKEERDQILWMLYSPALTVRERAVHENRLNRALAGMELLAGASIKKELQPLYKNLDLDFKITLL